MTYINNDEFWNKYQEDKMKNYQRRVINEKEKLDEKILRLESFTSSKIYKKLPNQERLLLTAQLGFMEKYSEILNSRIANFE